MRYMKLDMLLLPTEKRVLFDWDEEVYTVYYKDGSTASFTFGSSVRYAMSEEFLEWVPER